MIKMTRKWAMPNSDTFQIAPIFDLIARTIDGGLWVDPFVRNSPFKKMMTYSNDLNPDFAGTHNMDALNFLREMDDQSVDGVLFDPPYSPRQIQECYAGFGKQVTQQDTQAAFWGNLKKEICRITRPDALVISCCWNSGGCGRVNWFDIIEILIVPHGGWHNDTIVTVERKKQSLFDRIDL